MEEPKELALKILYGEAEKQEDCGQNQEKINQLDFNFITNNLKKIEELRKSGLINDQEYQQLKQTILK